MVQPWHLENQSCESCPGWQENRHAGALRWGSGPLPVRVRRSNLSKDYYLDKVDVQNGAKTLTAVCVPDSYQAGAKADLIVFLHGTNQNSAQAYLGQTEHDLRAELDSAKPVKNVVLIVPTLTTEARGGNLGGDDS